jgi:hypothetical protein
LRQSGASQLTRKEFAKYLERDLGLCYHCGRSGADLVPQHRIGRGMGGKNSKADQPANIITFCSEANFKLEADPAFAELGRVKGWKLTSSANPELEPVWEARTGLWWYLNNQGYRGLFPLI